MSMSRGGRSGSKLASWLWRAPRRALGRARDLYVRSLTGCAGHLPPDAAFFGYPSFAAAPLSSSRADYSFFSSCGNGDDDDLRELIRAASQRRAAAAAEQPVAVARSQSVIMARIDEDQPCEFAGAGAGMAFGRSRSCAAVAGGRAGGRRGRGSRLWLS